MRRDVSEEQAALIAGAMDAQREAIVSALDGLSRKLGFRETPGPEISGSVPMPDVLAARRVGDEQHIFVAHARGFTEPVHDAHHQERVHWWLRRFARLVDGTITGGYLVVGAYDETSAYAWATLLTRLARPHRIQRDGAPARFVVRRLSAFWMVL